MGKKSLYWGILLPLILLVIDILWFFYQHPDPKKEYVGHINIGAGNLYLLTKEILDFRAVLFLFLVLIPSLLISAVIATIMVYTENNKPLQRSC